MNAIARAVYIEDNFYKNVPFGFELPELKTLILVCLLLISALGVVYVKDLNRRLFIAYHKLQIETEQLQVSGNKLLLEYGAWGSQARVQVVAQTRLQMQIPPSVDVMTIKV
jgi:cell division protein FtsL